MPPVPAGQSAAGEVLPGVRRSVRSLVQSMRYRASCGREALARVRPRGRRANYWRDRFSAPESYTPKHLAAKILTPKTAREGERKQVTVLFADLKGATPEEAEDPSSRARAHDGDCSPLRRHGKSRASCRSRRTTTRTIEAKGYQP